MKLLSGITLSAFPVVAWAAQFRPETGGYLDADENWTEARTVCAVAKFQSGPLLISTADASLPGASGTLNYWNCVYTNDFGIGNVLHLHSKALLLDRGAALYQISGGIDAGGSASSVSGTTSPAKFALTGAGSSFSGYQLYLDALGSTVIANELELSNGARISLTGALLVSGGNNAALVRVSGIGTTLASSTSLLIGTAARHDSTTVSDVPGVRRSVRIEDGASASFTTGVSVGQQSGGCELQVVNGATLAAGNLTVADAAPDANGGPTNNEVSVSAAQIALTGNCVVGADASASGNAVAVTNHGTLHASGVLIVGQNGVRNSLVASGAGSAVVVDGKAFVGGRSGVTGAVAPSNNVVQVEDHASLEIADDVHVGMAGGSGNSLQVSSGASLAAKSIALYSGNSLVVEGARLELTNGITMTTSAAVGSVAAFTNSMVVFGQSKYADVGGNASLMVFSGCCVSVPLRWKIQGSGFTMCIDNSLFEYSDPSEWFITGGTAAESPEQKRTLVFEGANPHLKVTGSKGVFLRGGVDLVFNLGEGGFPTDHAVVDLTDSSAQFSGNDLGAHRVLVNVSDNCPSGVYTLMRGKNCGTFLTGANAYRVEPARHKLICATQDGVDVLRVRVVNSGIVLIVL